jgi:NADH:ubiquinone oxidoreductase subunit C
MTNEEIKEYITSVLPSATFDETGEWLNILIEPGSWMQLAKSLRFSNFNFDYLFCLTCIDWKTHLTMVYHFLPQNIARPLCQSKPRQERTRDRNGMRYLAHS